MALYSDPNARKRGPKPKKAKELEPLPEVVVEGAPAGPPPEPLPEPPPPSPQTLALSEDSPAWTGAQTLFLQGEETDSVDPTTNLPIRRWPDLVEVAHRHGLDPDLVRDRARLDGWQGRRESFRTSLEQARRRAIAERIVDAELPARLAYLSIHGKAIRALTKRLDLTDDKLAEMPLADIKDILAATDKAAEIMAKAQGRAKDHQLPMIMAVVAQQAHALNVPVPGLPAALQPPKEVEAVGMAQEEDGPAQGSLWSVLVSARESAPPSPSPGADPFDRPSPLPAHLASDRK